MTIGREIIRLPSTNSTMDEVELRAKAGAAEGLVVLADEQTAGRGRMGRVWSAPPATSVLCSVLFRPGLTVDQLMVLPLLIGVAVAETIEVTAGADCTLKWPNDVLINSKKVAGVLLQTRLMSGSVDYAIAGIGINVTTAVDSLPLGATSLVIETGRQVSREAVFQELLVRLQAVYDAFLTDGGRTTLESWRRRAAFIGEEIVIEHNVVDLRGVFTGVDEEGRLLLTTAAGEQMAISSGEIQRGPRPI